MPTIECLVGELKVDPALPSIPLTLAGETIPEYFAAASRRGSGRPAVNLALDAGARVVLPADPGAGVNARQLHEGLARLTQLPLAAQPSGVSTVGLILTSSYVHRPTAFGFMFDLGFRNELDPSDSIIYRDVPRTGCAVFLDTIRAAHPQDLDAQGNDLALPNFRYQACHTAVHEIGHLFNLWHVDDPSFLGLRFGGDVSLFPAEFVRDHRTYLQRADDPDAAQFIRPGIRRFMDWGPFPEAPATPPPFAGAAGDDPAGGPGPQTGHGPRLRIDMSQREFFMFEPVELDVRISVPPGTKAVKIPDEVDPGYDRFAIWVTRPDGERRRYRSPKYFCESGRTVVVGPATPFRRDISVFGQSGGYTFQMAGGHRIQAVFRLSPRRLLVSNVQEFEVCAPTGATRKRYERMRAALTGPAASKLLYYRAGPLPRRLTESLRAFVARFARTPAASGTLYALGRAELAAGLSLKHRPAREARIRRALEDLRRVADHVHLSPHRRRRAHELVAQHAGRAN